MAKVSFLTTNRANFKCLRSGILAGNVGERHEEREERETAVLAD